jgi:hypothetical protein
MIGSIVQKSVLEKIFHRNGGVSALHTINAATIRANPAKTLFFAVANTISTMVTAPRRYVGS